MQYRRLGASGLKVSEVCLGSWLTYGGSTDDATAEACVDKAYSLGINFYDTSNVYARGEAERVVGAALRKYPRDSWVIATKLFFPMNDGPMPNNGGLSRKHIREQCDASLKRLGVDYIDLYQCHRYDPETPLEETLRALDDLITAGKVLYIGFSLWTPDQINEAIHFQKEHQMDRFVSSQPPYNLLRRDIEAEVIPTCDVHGIGQIVFSPLAQGLLTGKYKPGQPLPAGSRASDPEQNMFLNRGNLDTAMLAKIQKLAPIAQSLNCTIGQLALAWNLRLASISSVIVGATRPDQVAENAGASGVKLTPETIQAIEAIFA